MKEWYTTEEPVNMDDKNAEMNQKYLEIVLPNSILLLFGMALGVVGNVAILIIYLFRIDDKKGDRYFIPVLATVDCLGSLSNASFYVIDNFRVFSFPNDILCRILLFSLTIASGFSGHLLCAIAVQRYLLICHPFGKQFSLNKRRITLVVIAVLSFLYGLPLLIISGIKTSEKTFLNETITGSMCVFDVHPSSVTIVYFGSFLLLTIINMLATGSLYVPIARSVYKIIQKRKLCQRTNLIENTIQISNIKVDMPHVNTKVHHKEEEKSRRLFPDSKLQGLKTKLNVMFLVIIAFYFVSYIPSLVILILTYTLSGFYYLQLSREYLNLWIFCARFLLLNHIINPFVYGYFDVKLKSEFKNIFCFCKAKLYALSVER